MAYSSSGRARGIIARFARPAAQAAAGSAAGGGARDVAWPFAAPPLDASDDIALAQDLLRLCVLWHDATGEPLIRPRQRILLDLFVQQQAGHQIAVSSACVASGAPGSTALRYLATLERAGLIAIVDDRRDLRRRLVSLTARARTTIGATLTEARGALATG